MKFKCIHCNINITDIERSVDFYQKALGMKVVRNDLVLGVVDNIQNYGGGDILELDNGDLISFVGADVDLKNKIIRF